MKRLTSLVTAALALAALISTAQAQQTLYWDKNGTTPGFVDSGAFGDGTWDSGTTLIWTTDPTGQTAPIAWNDAASPLDNAIIDVAGGSGTNASGWVTEDAGISITGTRTTNTVTLGRGSGDFQWIVFTGGGTISAPNGLTILDKAKVSLMPTPNFAAGGAVIDTGTNNLTINAGGQLDIGGTNTGSVRLNSAGKVVLNGGTLFERNSGSAGSFISALKGLEVNGSGTIGYDDGNGIPDNQVSIYSGVITGTGGTTTNGGAGTLIKTGPDQIGIGATTVGGVSSQSLFTFAKLVVKQGGYRGRNQTFDGTVKETIFGAVPLATLADAITLDGGGIGSNATVTLDAKRGITVTANGGYLDHGAGAGLTIPGPLTAAAGSTLTIGDPTSTSTSNPGFTLSNAGNTASFQGNLFMYRGTLTLASSLNAVHFSGASASATTAGTLTVNSGVTFTGGDGVDASFDGKVTGAGVFTKVGNSILTLNPATTEWSNTGGVNINVGTIKYGTSAAGFSSAATISIASGAKLDMNGINDSFGALSGPAGGTVDMIGGAATPGNLTLAAASPVNTTYSGTITGGGNLTKSSSSTQVLAGNTTLGAVAVNGGTLINNATMTTSGGVTVAAAGALGGTGTIVGAIGNSGVIAPGASVGTLSVTGNVTQAAGAIWHNELSGATTDLLAVTGNIDLSAAGDFLSVTGAGTGTSWVIGSYTGTLAGIFDNVTSGYTVNYGTGTNSVITLNAVPAGLPGDFNSDGKVDAGDYSTWRKADGTNNALANDNGLGTPIGPAHYALWRANFGNPPGAGSGGGLSGGAVPEPGTLVLAIFGLAMAVASGRRR